MKSSSKFKQSWAMMIELLKPKTQNRTINKAWTAPKHKHIVTSYVSLKSQISTIIRIEISITIRLMLTIQV